MASSPTRDHRCRLPCQRKPNHPPPEHASNYISRSLLPTQTSAPDVPITGSEPVSWGPTAELLEEHRSLTSIPRSMARTISSLLMPASSLECPRQILLLSLLWLLNMHPISSWLFLRTPLSLVTGNAVACITQAVRHARRRTLARMVMLITGRYETVFSLL